MIEIILAFTAGAIFGVSIMALMNAAREENE